MWRRDKAAGMLLAGCVIAAGMLCGCGAKEEYVEVSDIADSFPLEAEAVEVNPQLADSDGPYAVVHTTAGDVTILLYPEQAPKAVENFIGLAESGYYDGSSFFYVKRGEVVQGGRPAALDAYMRTEAAAKGELPPEGTEEHNIWGKEGFEDEFSDELFHFPGSVSMAGAVNGTNQNLSQFFFLLQEDKAEDEQVIPINLYMNELIAIRGRELNERNQGSVMTEEEIQKFEDDLNAEIQNIKVDGVPEAYAKRYEPALEQYRTYGGAWSMDYKYPVFGQIVKGLNVARAMSEVKVGASDRKPVKDILIEGIEIVDAPEG